MTFTIKVNSYDAVDTYTFDNVADAIRKWSKTRKVARVGRTLNILQVGDYMLVNTSWTYSYYNENIGDKYRHQANSLVNDRSANHMVRRLNMHVTSDEYPYSIINDEAVCLLSKVKKTPVAIHDNKKAFYMVRAEWNAIKGTSSARHDYTWIFTSGASCNDYTTSVKDVLKLCDSYEDDIVTLAVLGAAYSRAANTGDVYYPAANQIQIIWAVSAYQGFFPFILTPIKMHQNVFTPEHILVDICAILYKESNGGAFEQLITLNTPNDKVSLLQYRTYSQMIKKQTYEFVPLTDVTPTFTADNIISQARDIGSDIIDTSGTNDTTANGTANGTNGTTNGTNDTIDITIEIEDDTNSNNSGSITSNGNNNNGTNNDNNNNNSTSNSNNTNSGTTSEIITGNSNNNSNNNGSSSTNKSNDTSSSSKVIIITIVIIVAVLGIIFLILMLRSGRGKNIPIPGTNGIPNNKPGNAMNIPPELDTIVKSNIPNKLVQKPAATRASLNMIAPRR